MKKGEYEVNCRQSRLAVNVSYVLTSHTKYVLFFRSQTLRPVDWTNVRNWIPETCMPCLFLHGSNERLNWQNILQIATVFWRFEDSRLDQEDLARQRIAEHLASDKDTEANDQEAVAVSDPDDLTDAVAWREAITGEVKLRHQEERDLLLKVNTVMLQMGVTVGWGSRNKR